MDGSMPTVADEAGDKSKRTRRALEVACVTGSIELADAILRPAPGASLDISSPNECGWSPIYIASRKGHTAIVQQLISAGADVTVADKDGRTPLYAAVYGGGHIDAVRVLLKHGADALVGNENNMTPLNLAATEGYTELVRLFIDLGALVNDCDTLEGWTPLSVAASGGHTDIVKMLLDSGAKLDARLHDGSTTLGLAATWGTAGLIELLLDHGAGVDMEAKNNAGKTPLFLAGEFGKAEAASCLITHGADVLTRDSQRSTPLTLAARWGHTDAVSLLIRHKIDVNATDEEGWSALTIAVSYGHVDVCRALLDAGAEISHATGAGWTCLTIAADCGHVDVVRLLIDRGVDLEVIDNDLGFSSLSCACNRGFVDVVRLLLQAGANAHHRDNEGLTPFAAAAFNGHVETMKVLIEAGVDMSTPNIRGATPLHGALFHGHVGAAMLLLKQAEDALDVDAVDEGGCTPLLTASQKGFPAVVSTLLDRGADLSRSDSKGYSALHLAATERHMNIIKDLLNRGAVVNRQANNGATALTLAGHHGYVDVIELLLEHGADPGIKDTVGRSALHNANNAGQLEAAKMLLKSDSDVATYDVGNRGLLTSACMNGHLDMVKLLLEEASDQLPRVDPDGMTPTCAAAIAGQVHVLKLLVAEGFDFVTPTSIGMAPINVAAEHGHVDVIQLLLENGAPMSPNPAGFFPIHTAAYCGHVEVIKLLMEFGANLDSGGGKNKLRPVSMAVANDQTEAIEFLLDAGADISTYPGQVGTDLHVAASGGTVKALEVLLASDRGYDIHARTSLGDTPLCLAAFNGQSRAAEVLLEAGADLHVFNHIRAFPIHQAVMNGGIKMVELLLDAGSNLSVADENGSSPLTLALTGGSIELVEFLVDKYADPVIAEREGRPAVDRSLLAGFVMLAKQNAFINGTTGIGESLPALNAEQLNLDMADRTASPLPDHKDEQVVIPIEPPQAERNAELTKGTEVAEAMESGGPSTGNREQAQLTPAGYPWKHPLPRPCPEPSGVICIHCRGIFEYQAGRLPFDIWYMVNIVSNQDPRTDSDLPPSNDKAPGFLHHMTAASMKAAAEAGCYICQRAWSKIRPEMVPAILEWDRGRQQNDEDGRGMAFSFVMVYDQESTLASLKLNKADDVDKGTIWSIVLDPSAMRCIKMMATEITMFTLVSDKDIRDVDRVKRLAPTHTDSEESLSFATSQYQDCVQEHEECRRGTDPSWLPTRLIDIGCVEDTADGEGSSARLVTTRDLDRPTRYCTLSHCWGKAQVVKLLKSNLDAFLGGLPVSELPKTFRDSLCVARRLGIRYIWIDSLCIIQDDGEDWLSEASQMHSVYSNSDCNICATSASDSSQGLFVERKPDALDPCDVWIPWLDASGTFRIVDVTMWKEEIGRSPLHTRAWVVQEHLLSPRQLHFGAKQVSWECLRAMSSEQYPGGLPPEIPNLEYYSRRQLHRAPPLPPRNGGMNPKWATRAPKNLLTSWTHVVQSYMNAGLSHMSDKAIAFAGIAQRFGAIMGDESVAGIWRKNAAFGLLWRVDYCRQGDGSPSWRPDVYRAPSFSWMSVEGSIDMGAHELAKEDGSNVKVKVLSLDMTESRGVVSPGASIRLDCVIKPLKIRRHFSGSGVQWLARFRHGKPQLGFCLSMAGTVLMDVDKDYGDATLYCMTIRAQDDDAFISGLVLEEVTGEARGVFRRIGYFQAGGIDKGLLLAPYVDEAEFPCEEYDPVTKRHVIRII